MSDPFTGQINPFPYTFAPRGWAFCEGQLLAIGSNHTLYSLLQRTYGGDSRTTFKLPNFRGALAIGSGQGPYLRRHALGHFGGTAKEEISINALPAHDHMVQVEFGPNADSVDATDNYLPSNGPRYAPQPTPGRFLKGVIADESNQAGGNQPHENMMPYLTLNYCISLFGSYPRRS